MSTKSTYEELAAMYEQRNKEHMEVLDEAVKLEADRNRLARKNERLRREVRYLRRKYSSPVATPERRQATGQG